MRWECTAPLNLEAIIDVPGSLTKTASPRTGTASRPGAGRRPGAPSRSGDRFRAPLLALLLTLAVPAAVFAHAYLASSAPAADSVVRAPVTEVHLTFSEALELRYTGVTILGADGTEIPADAIRPVPGSRRDFVAALAAPLGAGAYTVRWRTAGADGHVVQGAFGFTVEADPAAPPPLPTPATAEPVPDPTPPPSPAALELNVEHPLAVGVRFVHFLALLGLIGAVAFRWGVAERMPRDARTVAMAAPSSRGALRVAGAVLALLALAVVGRLWLQSTLLHGPAEAWSPDALGTLLSGTTWGRAWLLQLGAATLLLLGLVLARGEGRGAVGWATITVAVLLLAVVPALSGHAVAVPGIPALAVLNDTLHVLGGGVWLGTLAVLVLAGFPTVGTLPRAERAPAVAGIVSIFSPVALTGAGLVGLTGVVNALFHLTAPLDLWTTGYGRAVLLKVALLAAVAGLGFYHWRVAGPRLGTDGTARTVRRSSSGELALGVLVVLVTAVLVARPTPLPP